MKGNEEGYTIKGQILLVLRRKGYLLLTVFSALFGGILGYASILKETY
jgi:hypothetical protein